MSLNFYLELSLIVLGEFSESKISNFGPAVMHEDIGNLDIAMYNIILCKIDEPFNDIP
jgi:hypothetical protein